MDKNRQEGSPRKLPTIYDIAKAANVSPGTVSRVINRVGYVKSSTRDRVTQVIADLKYVPNRAARSLKNKRTNIICLAFPESDNPFFFSMIHAVQGIVQEHGYSLMIYHTGGKTEEEIKIMQLMNERIADGLLLINFNYSEEHFKVIRRIQCPLVLSSLCVSPYGGNDTDLFDYVGIDVRQAMYMAVSHFFHQGHTNIALIGGDRSICVFRERYEGYCSAFAERSIPVNQDNCMFGGYNQEAGYRSAMEILELPERPTAICVINDVTAIGAVMALREKGVRIPEDIAIVSLDNTSYAQCQTPPLSSIHMAQTELGACMARFLLERINGDDSPPKKIIYQPKLITRESSRRIIWH